MDIVKSDSSAKKNLIKIALSYADDKYSKIGPFSVPIDSIAQHQLTLCAPIKTARILLAFLLDEKHVMSTNPPYHLPRGFFENSIQCIRCDKDHRYFKEGKDPQYL